MQRFMDKWGMWIAFVIVGSIIMYGLISGYMKVDEPEKKGNAAQAAPAPAGPKGLD